MCKCRDLHISLLTTLRRLYITFYTSDQQFARGFASFIFHDAVGTLTVQLTLPRAGFVKEFHLSAT
jgi:hypothetical protein